MTADPQADALAAWLATHPGQSSDHERRIIDADLLPGASRGWVGDEDPFGHEADRAAARSANRETGA